MVWFSRIKDSKESLDNHIGTIKELIEKYNVNANQFKEQFPDRETSKPFDYLSNYDEILRGQAAPQLQKANH